MGYEINSTWTRMHKTDIEELNDIIDDKYCREMEIARKLNLMKKFKEAFDKEINSLENEVRRVISMKNKLLEEIEALDPEDKHFGRMKSDLSDRIYALYDKIDEAEDSLMIARKKKIAVNTSKLEADNIYKTLMYFDTLYYKMDDNEKHDLLSILIKEINIYEDKQPNGQWLKQIVFALPIIGNEDLYVGLDNGNPVETVVLMSKA